MTHQMVPGLPLADIKLSIWLSLEAAVAGPTTAVVVAAADISRVFLLFPEHCL
jgi:hypothetical protein